MAAGSRVMVRVWSADQGRGRSRQGREVEHMVGEGSFSSLLTTSVYGGGRRTGGRPAREKLGQAHQMA